MKVRSFLVGVAIAVAWVLSLREAFAVGHLRGSIEATSRMTAAVYRSYLR